MKKVYCKDCKWYARNYHHFYCMHPKNIIKDTSYIRMNIDQRIDGTNKNNDCRFFEAKKK